MEEINYEVLPMIEMIDFTNCELSSRNLEYGGRAGEKKGIIYNNEFWFLKFPKNTLGKCRRRTYNCDDAFNGKKYSKCLSIYKRR